MWVSPINSFNSMHDFDPNATFGHVAAELSTRGLAYLRVVETDVAGATEEPQYEPQHGRGALRTAYRGT